MSREYYTHYNGEYTHVYPLDDCIKAIKCRNDNNEKRIKYLEEENRKLKEKYNKDEEIQKMQQRLNEMQKDYYRGFPISEKEEKKISEWKEKHDVEAHGLNTLNKKLKAGGCIGGRYSYHFVPTSIGVSGTVRCSCGAEFEFQEIG